MTCILICIWITVFVSMIRAVIVKDILWPQKQEDRDEGGWTGPVPELKTEAEDMTTDGPAGQVDGPVQEAEFNMLTRAISSFSKKSKRKRGRSQGEV